MILISQLILRNVNKMNARKFIIKVCPNAKVEKIVENGDCLKVYVNAAPEKGKANKRVCDILAKHFSVRKSSVKVIKGHTSKEKVIEISE